MFGSSNRVSNYVYGFQRGVGKWRIGLALTTISGTAFAGVFSGLATNSDPATPDYMSYMSMQEPSVQVASMLGEVAPTGDASHSVAIDALPGLLPPQVSLTYQASGGASSFAGSGWSISTGMTIQRLSRSAEANSYGNVDEPLFRVSGGGLGGMLVGTGVTETVNLWQIPTNNPSNVVMADITGVRYDYVGTDPMIAAAWHDPVDNTWVVRSGAVFTYLAPAGITVPAVPNPDFHPPAHVGSPRSWVVRQVLDTQGNVSVYGYESGRVTEILYAANVRAREPSENSTMVNEYGTARIRFEYDALPQPWARSWTHGVEIVYDHQLYAVHVEAIDMTVAQAGSTNYPATPSHSYELAYEDRLGSQYLIGVDKIGSDGVTSIPVAAFDYTEWSGEAEDRYASIGDLWDNAPSVGSSQSYRESDEIEVTSLGGVTVGYAHTWVTSRLEDINGDGLSDQIVGLPADSGTGELRLGVRYQLASGEFEDFDEDAGVAAVFDDYAFDPTTNADAVGALEMQESVDVTPDRVASFTRRQLIDFDGDGHLDVVESGPQLDMVVPYDSNDIVGGAPSSGPIPTGMWDAHLDASQGGGYDNHDHPLTGLPGFVWRIRRGLNDGSFDAPVEIIAPFPYTTVSARDSSCRRQLGHHEDWWQGEPTEPWDASDPGWIAGYHGEVVSLMDTNGDGRLDIVYYPSEDWSTATPSAPLSYPSNQGATQCGVGTDSSRPIIAPLVFTQRAWDTQATTLKSGFGATHTPLAPAGSAAEFALASRCWNQPRLAEKFWDDWLDLAPSSTGTPDPSAVRDHPTCTVDLIDKVRGFADINGDGLVDFIDSEWTQRGSAPGGGNPYWDVYLGTGEGLSGQPIPWQVEANGWVHPGQADVWNPDGLSTYGNHWRVPVGLTRESSADPGSLPQGSFGGFNPNFELDVRDREGEGLPGGGLIQGEPDPGQAPPATTSSRSESDLLVALMDIDGDGLQDLVFSTPGIELNKAGKHPEVIAEAQWWRNTATGFLDEEACDERATLAVGGVECDWLAGGLSSSTSYSGSVLQSTSSYSGFVDRRVVRDMNGDGLLDVLGEESSDIAIGVRSGLLREIDNRHGGRTVFSYSRATNAPPIGDPSEVQRGTSRQFLVSSVRTIDDITKHQVRTSYTYEDPVCLPGQCLGFERVTAFTEQLQWNLGNPIKKASFNMQEAVWLPHSEKATSFELSRDLAKPVEVTVSVDASMPQVPVAYQRLPSADPWPVRYRTTSVWMAWENGAPVGPCEGDDTIPVCRLFARTVQHYGDDGSGGDMVHFGYDYDANGLLTNVVQSSAGLDTLETTITWWVHPTDAIAVMRKQEKRSRPSGTFSGGTLIDLFEAAYDQPEDGSGVTPNFAKPPTEGKLTAKRICGAEVGTAGCGAADWLLWTFGYDRRGQLSVTIDPRGEATFIDGYGFGGTVPLAVRNALGHTVATGIDDLGRPVITIGPNGDASLVGYDALGRVQGEGKCGVGNSSGQTPCTGMKKIQYVDNPTQPGTPAVPSYTFTSVPVIGSPTAYDTFSYTLTDGWGRPLQTWTPTVDHDWVVQTTLTDLFGNQRYTSVPTRATWPADNDAALARGLATEIQMGANHFDAMGTAVLTFADHTLGSQCAVQTVRPDGNTQATIDSSGRIRQHRTNAYGQLVEVKEGGGNLSAGCLLAPYTPPQHQVAQYDHDGLGRITSFTDAPGGSHQNTWHYEYDMAGRQRRVLRSTGGGTPTPYRSFLFDAGLPIEMYEGSASPANAVMQWDYDSLDRIVAKRVRGTDGNPDVSTWKEWTWVWDLFWIGAKAGETAPGPSGTIHTILDYVNISDNTPCTPIGQTGQVCGVFRSFGAERNRPTQQTFSYDALGRTATTTFPSGSTVSNSFVNGALDHQDLDLWFVPTVPGATPPDPATWSVAPTVDTITYDYDEFGEVSSWSSTTGHHMTIERSRPGVIDFTTWGTPTGESLDVGYVYGADDRLFDKSYSLSAGLEGTLAAEGVSYGYDLFGRVSMANLYTSSSSTVVEELFTYDTMGNTTSFHHDELQPDGTHVARPWNYAVGPYNETLSRSDGTETETFLRDPVTGRVLQQLRTEAGLPKYQDVYAYDGSGQLVEVEQFADGTKVGGANLWHDLDDALLVKEVDNGTLLPEVALYADGWVRNAAPDGTTRVTESILPFLQIVYASDDADNGFAQRQWVYREFDGHGLMQFDDAGDAQVAEVLGTYGATMDSWSAAASGGALAWDLRDLNGFHGVESDVDLGLSRMGARHMRIGDGMWLQPEPLLGLGIDPTQLDAPTIMFGPYAAGNPVIHSDRSGYILPVLAAVAVFVVKEVATELVVQAAYKVDDKVGMAVELGTMVGSPTQMVKGTAKQVAKSGIRETAQAGLRAVVSKVDDAAAMIKSKGDDALATLKGSQCFVEGTEVLDHQGTIPIQSMREGDLVLAGNVESPILQARGTHTLGSSATAWSTPGHIKSPATSTWLASACESVRRAARTLVLPTAMLAACDVAPPPAAHDVVDVYDARSGTWSGDEAGNIQVGGELLHDGHLFLVTHDGIIDRGPVDAKALADADAAVTEVDVETQPTGASWVLVLADGDTDVRHATLADLELGDHFAFQGRVYETLGATRVEHVRETGEVLGRVVNTYVRTADDVFDVHIAYPDGSVDTLTGTPNHPFWVPSVQDYVELKDLEVGTVLQTYGGSEATVLGLTWKPGGVEVYDIEVEGLHNFFVRGSGSDAPGVLVHNSTATDAAARTSRRPTAAQREGALERAQDATGTERCTYCGTELDRKAGSPNSAEIDHVNPYSKGGETVDDNLAASCRTCNRSKGAKELDTEWVPPKDRPDE